jgi:cobyric acid synthase
MVEVAGGQPATQEDKGTTIIPRTGQTKANNSIITKGGRNLQQIIGFFN